MNAFLHCCALILASEFLGNKPAAGGKSEQLKKAMRL
jgi:hypothetical protein